MNKPTIYELDRLTREPFEAQPPIPSVTTILNDYAAKHRPDPAKAVKELSQEEKFALCILAGVPMQYDTKRSQFRTTVQVGFVKQDGQFRVIQDRPQQRGHEIKFRVRRSIEDATNPNATFP